MVSRCPMITIQNLNLSVGNFRLKDISFRVKKGEYFILLGPTGCGKTMLAESICGLNIPQEGLIFIGGREVTGIDPSKRKIGYVPQDYGLLPFKTVLQNIAFGLQARGHGQRQTRQRTSEVLEMLNIGHLKERMPTHLSGGERQRVALGRALAIEPDVLVMDEPLSALDESTCTELMKQLKMLHSRLDTTFFHICHRLEEALTLGDAIALMRNGRMEQIGEAQEVFSRPRNSFVAGFLQLPNLIEGEVQRTPSGNVFSIDGVHLKHTELPEGKTYAVIPLQKLVLCSEHPGEKKGFVVFECRVEENYTDVHKSGLRVKGQIELVVPGIFSEKDWSPEKKVFVKFPLSKLHLISEEDSGLSPKTL